MAILMSGPPREVTSTEDIEELDFAPLCQTTWCVRSQTPREAAYAVWSTLRRPCGCRPRMLFMYFCDVCWKRAVGAPTVSCRNCGAIYPFLDTVLHYARLGEES